MTPNVKFITYSNPNRMIGVIQRMLLPTRKGFDWSNVYAKEYPQFGNLISKVEDPDEIKNLSYMYFNELYSQNKTLLEHIANGFQSEWDKNGNLMLEELSKTLEFPWPDNCNNITAYPTLNPICPRFLREKSFEVYYKYSPKDMKKVALHEILHFIWFEKWKQVFPNSDEKEFEAPYLIWKLSEMVPQAVLGDERIQTVFPHSPSVYQEWKVKSINDKPLLQHLQEIYSQRNSFEDFMKSSLKFVQTHENEINA